MDDRNWRQYAACEGLDTAMFYPFDEPRLARAERTAAAKAVCWRCAALNQCREFALREGEPYGIWGGTTEHERAVVLGVTTLRYAGVNRQQHGQRHTDS